jgi:coenzyme PQQ precursor peptide PqqA
MHEKYRARRRSDMAAAPAVGAIETKSPKELPAPDSNFYQLVKHLTPDERAIVRKVREYKWTTPRIAAIAVGLEINGYACAELT